MRRKKYSKKSKHNFIANQTILEFQKEYPKGRLWRREPITTIDARTGNWIKEGQSGMSDLYGYVHAMGLALYLEIEIKTGKASLRKNQRVWRDTTFKNGGIFVVGREDTKQTLKEIEEHIQAVEARLK